jgi:RNA polymerase sigma-70 factor (sigma-E family)
MPWFRHDGPGFEEFFAARQRALCRAAFLLTGDDDEAEDLFQAAMVQAYTRWSHIVRRGTDPEAYVRKIMLNRVRDDWRARVRRRKRAHETSFGGTVPDTSDAVVDRHVLGALLRQLPAQQRAVLYLRFTLDYTEAQAAEALGCRVGTVKSHAHRGLTKLRAATAEPTRARHDDP